MDTREKTAVRLVAKLAPWIAPAPSAFFVYEAAREHLGVSILLGIVVATVIESLGITTVHTGLWMEAWNRSKRKTDPEAPVALAYALAGVYLLATLGLILVLEVAPELSHYAPAMFPFLAIVGAVNLALISQQEAREATVQKEKDERRESRRERSKMSKSGQVSTGQQGRKIEQEKPNLDVIGQQDSKTARLQAGKLSKKERRQKQLLDILTEQPGTGISELRDILGVSSRTTVYTDLEALEAQGAIVKNGVGYKPKE